MSSPACAAPRPTRTTTLRLAVLGSSIILAVSALSFGASAEGGLFGLFSFDPARYRVEARAEPTGARPLAVSRRVEARKRRRRIAALRRAAPHSSAAGSSARNAAGQTFCVRLCDGYAFPVGHLGRGADLAAHRTACSASCPGADTALYTAQPGRPLGEIDGARSVADGSLYNRLKTALLFRRQTVPNCSCQGPDHVASRLPIERDPTLRPGDVVVDRRGDAQAFDGSGATPHSRSAFGDYRRTAALSRQGKSDVDKLVGTSQRAALERAFNRTLRLREASLSSGQMREIAAPAGSGAGVRVFQADAGPASGSGARIILIR